MALVTKNDVTQIFAIQAPEVDLPPTFANYPRGWDTARSNNGKPTIKQFNYIQQRTDQNVLWIHQNGAALPYDATMEYAEGAVVVKDGELQKKQGASWVSTISKSLVRSYLTLDLANADIVNIATDVQVQTGDQGLWYKATAGATSLTKSSYDPLTQAKGYTDTKTKNIAEQLNANLDEAQDKNLNVYRYTDQDGGLHLVGLDTSVQDAINSKTAVDSLNQVRYQNILMHKFSKIKTLIPVAEKSEDDKSKRMPFAIKTPTGLVYFYHKQITGFDGDTQGSELWKAIITIDESLNVIVNSRELFLAPDAPRGIVKHPTLGRTSDGRIILMFEKRLETTDPYVRYQCYSSDEGVTFSTPTIIVTTGTNPSQNTVLGTTGTIVTAKNNRLIVPMYTTGGTCYCIYSDNDGATWVFSAWVDPAKLQGFEPSISLDMDDNLIMDVRPKVVGNRLRAKSLDNGLTWQVFSAQLIPSTTTQGVIFRDKSIGAMLQANATNQINENRTKYKIFISYDSSKTFPFVYQPFDDGWYGGYSQILKWKDGVYIIMIEYAATFTGVNWNENAGLLILSLSEVLSNVSSN